MTAAKIVPLIILDQGGSNELTIYTTFVEKVKAKKLTVITPPQSSANWGSGPKSSKIVDLLRVQNKFTVRGTINSADETKLENLFDKGGVINFLWKTVIHKINFEKLTITNDGREEQDETPIFFTAVEGVNL